MSKQSRQNIIHTLKNAFISQTHVDTVDTKKNHIQYIKDASSGFLLQFEVGLSLIQRVKSKEATNQRVKSKEATIQSFNPK